MEHPARNPDESLSPRCSFADTAAASPRVLSILPGSFDIDGSLGADFHSVLLLNMSGRKIDYPDRIADR
jgi:hypothetical protein